MSYRGLPTNIGGQVKDMLGVAGYIVRWDRFVSADGGNDIIGLEPVEFFDERYIRAFMRTKLRNDTLDGVGLIANVGVLMVSEMPCDERDRIYWGGERYRVDSPSIQNQLSKLWSTNLLKGDNN